jgi:hypothetical protein
MLLSYYWQGNKDGPNKGPLFITINKKSEKNMCRTWLDESRAKIAVALYIMFQSQMSVNCYDLYKFGKYYLRLSYEVTEK